MKGEIFISKSKLEATLINALISKQAYGESRHQAKAQGTDGDKIFSVKTMDKYAQVARDFSRYCDSKESGLRRKNQVTKYVDPYLQSLKDKEYSAWTQQTARSALTKVLGKDYSSIELDKKERCTIVRSRMDTENARHFSEERNEELIHFCQCTGLRRSELESLKPEQMFRISGDYYLQIKGKGGKERTVSVLGNDKRVVAKIAQTPKGEHVWGKVHSAANIHGYRADYAKALYKKYARPTEKLKKSEKYVCRKDLRGVVYDKAAMKIVSKNLGHNRIDVIASNYLYTIE